MDIQTLAAAIGIVKNIGDSAAARAETAAESAEASAAEAATHAYGIDVVGRSLMITDIEEEGE